MSYVSYLMLNFEKILKIIFWSWKIVNSKQFLYKKSKFGSAYFLFMTFSLLTLKNTELLFPFEVSTSHCLSTCKQTYSGSWNALQFWLWQLSEILSLEFRKII